MLQSRPHRHAPPHADVLDALLEPAPQPCVRDEPEFRVHALDGHLRVHERQPGPSLRFPLRLSLRLSLRPFLQDPVIRRVDLLGMLCGPLQRRLDQLPREALSAVRGQDGDAGELDVWFVVQIIFR